MNKPTRVARVGGYRCHGKEALPPTGWRRNLRHLAAWMLITFVMMLFSSFIVGVFA